MTSLRKVMTLSALAAASASMAHATPVTPGGPTLTATNAITVTNDGVVASTSGNLVANTYTGTYSEYVIRDGSNPYGVNDLTFVITVGNNAGSPNGIEQVTNGDDLGSFGFFPSVNVGYLAGGSGNVAPLTVDETIYGTVAFNFDGTDAITAGKGTQYLVIQTPATNFTTGNLAVIDSSTDTVQGFVPLQSTPEPSSLLFLGTGLVGGASALLRRRRSVAL